jgi:putative phosphoribosyl transferase
MGLKRRQLEIPVLTQDVRITSGVVLLQGELSIPEGATGIVIFVHGSGSSRLSPRNQYVARVLEEAGLATLLFDLLTKEEEELDMQTASLRFNIGLLAERLIDVTTRISRIEDDTSGLLIGYFGASTGAAAALVAAAELGKEINAVVSRGGRPDLAGVQALEKVKAPTLLIVGELDRTVIGLNEEAFRWLNSEKELRIVPGATHLFEEPGTLEEAARLATKWFERYLHHHMAGMATGSIN